jgi:hypothetical protein
MTEKHKGTKKAAFSLLEAAFFVPVCFLITKPVQRNVRNKKLDSFSREGTVKTLEYLQ